MAKFGSPEMLLLSRRALLQTAATGLLAVTAAPFLSPAGSADAATPSGGRKVLTVYYSRSGNTRAVARMIHSTVGGDIVELETVRPYPAEYRATTEQAKKELAANFYPPLKVTVDDIGAYGVVLVGSPCWWGTFASPVRGFLAQHDFAGKRLAPFITHEGSRMGRSVEDLKALCPGATTLEGLAVRGESAGGARTEVGQWLRRIGLDPGVSGRES